MNCFMFPGQPLTGSAVLPEDDDFHAVARLVREKAFFDLTSFSWLEKPSSHNVKLQLFGVAMSLYQCRRKRGEKLEPAIVTQHSMGIYPSLAACGCLPEAETLELTYRSGECLARMATTADYGLGCIIGLPVEPVLSLCRNNGVYLANHNTSRHFLISGTREKIETAIAESLVHGAFSAKVFHCDAPLHTPLIGTLEKDLLEIFSDYHYAEPRHPLVDHLDQQRLKAADLPAFMLRQLLLPVYWEKTYRTLVAMGVTRFYEIGPGEALKKFNRWIASENEHL